MPCHFFVRIFVQGECVWVVWFSVCVWDSLQKQVCWCKSAFY